MATVTPTVSYNGDFSVVTVSYTDLETGDDGAPFRFPEYPDRTVQVTGTFETSVLDVEGSLDGTNYAVLTDPVGNALEVAAADIAAISENAAYTRPLSVGGDAGTTLDVVFVCRRDQPRRT